MSASESHQEAARRVATPRVTIAEGIDLGVTSSGPLDAAGSHRLMQILADESAQEVLQSVENARVKGAEILDLGDLPIVNLPAVLGMLPNLRVLALGQIAVAAGYDARTGAVLPHMWRNYDY